MHRHNVQEHTTEIAILEVDRSSLVHLERDAQDEDSSSKFFLGKKDETDIEVEKVDAARDGAPGLGPADSSRSAAIEDLEMDGSPKYRLYRRRFLGVLGIIVLNIIGGMNWPWFGPIANNVVTDLGLTLDEVNWLGNVNGLMYVPLAPLIPYLCTRYGLRFCYMLGAVLTLLSAWVRYAGTANSLTPGGTYALFFIAQLLTATGQALFQVLAPKYSETWFDVKGRTTATMIMSIANPVGSALGQLISPLPGSTRTSILILGVISSAATPFAFLVESKPPTPPTFAGSVPSPTLKDVLRALFGPIHPKSSTVHEDLRHPHGTIYITKRERFDFLVIFVVFSALLAATNTFALLSAQIVQPYGYSDDTAGLLGAVLLLAGIVAAIATSPIFDRVLTNNPTSLALGAKILTPVVALGWFSLIWAVRPNNTIALYVIMAVTGAAAVAMLPIGLELACEVTRCAEASSAALWAGGNLLAVVFVLAETALRDPDSANPPQNMHRSLVFNGVFVLVASASIFLLRGRQVRRERDVQEA